MTETTTSFNEKEMKQLLKQFDKIQKALWDLRDHLPKKCMIRNE